MFCAEDGKPEANVAELLTAGTVSYLGSTLRKTAPGSGFCGDERVKAATIEGFDGDGDGAAALPVAAIDGPEG